MMNLIVTICRLKYIPLSLLPVNGVVTSQWSHIKGQYTIQVCVVITLEARIQKVPVPNIGWETS